MEEVKREKRETSCFICQYLEECKAAAEKEMDQFFFEFMHKETEEQFCVNFKEW